MRAAMTVINFALPPAMSIGAIPAAVLVVERGLLDYSSSWDPPALVGAGAGMLSIGLALEAWCLASFHRRGQTWNFLVAPSVLVTDGPYRYSRHPVYVGAVAMLLGGTMLFGSPGLGVYLALYVLFVDRVLVARFEEPQLERRFDGDYVRYRDSVRRWL